MQIQNYAEALAFIHGRRKFTKSPDLARMRKFAHYLGDPQQKVKFIHVTGTNGKGSTVAYLSNLLQSQGFTVGTFTSPFITRFNERIAVNGVPIADEKLVELVQKIKPVVERLDAEYAGEGPKEFEVVTMLMFLYFAEIVPDYAVVEVGIGGTYDSTNILTPVLSVITEVALDHIQILGDTLAQIAQVKAGIIKAKRPVVVGALDAESLQVITQVANEKEAKLYTTPSDYSWNLAKTQDFWGQIFTYNGFGKSYRKLKIKLLGDYQVANASLALSAFLCLAQLEKFTPRESEIRKALITTSWPARFELINEEPLVVLDGAHNLDAVKKLAQILKTRFSEWQIYVVMSVLADKRAPEMFACLQALPNVTLSAVEFDAPRAVADFEFLQGDGAIKYYSDWREVLPIVLREMSADDMLLFTGSLYFVSEVRNYFV